MKKGGLTYENLMRGIIILKNGYVEESMIKRKGTEFCKKLPKDAGVIVAMCVHNDTVFIAAQHAVFYLSEKKRLMRCKFGSEVKA